MYQRIDNFFRRMLFVERVFNGKQLLREDDNSIIIIKEESKRVFQRLIYFVESGTIADGEAKKFICRNWRLDVKRLQEKWKAETGKTKSAGAFRKQISAELSPILYKLFGLEFDIDLLQNKTDELKKKLSMAEIRNLTFQDIIPLNMFDYADTVFAETYNYDIEDLTVELKTIKRFRNDLAKKMFNRCDRNKLHYIKTIIESSGVDDGKREEILKILGFFE